MKRLLMESLARYGLENSKARLIRHNENATYRVEGPEGDYTLRIHIPSPNFSLRQFGTDRHSLEAVQGEMEVMQGLRKQGLRLQEPQKNLQGELVSLVEQEVPVTLLQWVLGKTLEEKSPTLEVLERVGESTARMHALSQRWSREEGRKVYRYRYDRSLLLRLSRILDSKNQQGKLPHGFWRVAEEYLEQMNGLMRELEEVDPPILIHADLSPSNLLLSRDGAIIPIDFCLGGWGWPAMDVGGLLSQFTAPAQQKALLRGYRRGGGAVALRETEGFFALGILLYLSSHTDSVYQKEWFSSALDRWKRDYFTPFVRSRSFLGELSTEC